MQRVVHYIHKRPVRARNGFGDLQHGYPTRGDKVGCVRKRRHPTASARNVGHVKFNRSGCNAFRSHAAPHGPLALSASHVSYNSNRRRWVLATLSLMVASTGIGVLVPQDDDAVAVCFSEVARQENEHDSPSSNGALRDTRPLSAEPGQPQPQGNNSWTISSKPPLGVGAYGEVREGTLSHNGERVAIKQSELHTGQAKHSARREIDALGLLKSYGGCPQIIELKDYHENESTAYLVTELVEGYDLFTYLETEGDLSEKTVAHIVMEVALALEFMHAHGVIHMDIKPENIMLSKPSSSSLDVLPHVKVVDFGSALLLQPESTASNADSDDNPTVRPRGTLSYLPPEVFIEKNYSAAMDIWALGLIMWMMLVMSHPFDNAEELSEEELIGKICNGPLTMKGRRWRRVSADAKDLLRKMLEQDPQNRASIEDVLTHPWILRNIGPEMHPAKG